MKAIIKIITSLLFISCIYAEEQASVKIARVNTSELQKSLGYEELRKYEYGEKYRNAYKKLNAKLEQLEDKLINAKEGEDLDKVTLELGFLQKKQRTLKTLAQSKGTRSSQAQLKALIIKEFSDKYPIILMDSYNTNLFNNAIHCKVEYVDITSKVEKLILNSMNAKQEQ